MLQELEKADPHNVLYHLDVAGVTASVGRGLAGAGKDAEGLAMLQKAIGVLQENYARDHSYTDIPYWLGQDHIWRGEILARTGDAPGALDEYYRGASSLEGLMSGTVSPNTLCDIAASYTKVGTGYAAVGNGTEASTAYRKALEIAEPLVSSKPMNVLGLYAAADAYFEMGELAKSAAQRSRSTAQGEELQHWREACDWYRKSMDACA
jgi:tetratricopeptide (TPR) repeat protein